MMSYTKKASEVRLYTVHSPWTLTRVHAVWISVCRIFTSFLISSAAMSCRINYEVEIQWPTHRSWPTIALRTCPRFMLAWSTVPIFRMRSLLFNCFNGMFFSKRAFEKRCDEKIVKRFLSPFNCFPVAVDHDSKCTNLPFSLIISYFP